MRNEYKVLVGKPEGNRPLGTRRILKKYGDTGIIGQAHGHLAVSSEHGNGALGFIKGGTN
jgi:hypothetical protein